MICAKKCKKLSKFIEVTAKILSVPFLWDTLYIDVIDDGPLTLYMTLLMHDGWRDQVIENVLKIAVSGRL